MSQTLVTPLNDQLLASISQQDLTAAYRELAEQRIAVKAYQQKLDDLTQFVIAGLKLKVGSRQQIEITMGIDLELHPEWHDDET